MKKIIIKGAREHNLKNIDLELPRDKFVVITGVSGSGKSSLAFDTIFAEGQRRYLESLSSYARQFLGQMEKPDVDLIEGLSPCVAIDQKTSSRNPRSTVGTVTEIQDYLRLLYAKIGVPHCPECGRVIEKLTLDEIVEKVIELGKNVPKAEILAPVVRGRKGEYLSLLNDLFLRGYARARLNGEKVYLKDFKSLKLSRYKKHEIDVIVDEVVLNTDNMSRVFEACERALDLSCGLVKVRTDKKEWFFNQGMSCPDHDSVFPPLEPRLFSFNSPYGACPSCEGLGEKKIISLDLVLPDKTKTLAEGAILPWSYKKNNYFGTLLRGVLNEYGIPDNARVKDLAPEQLDRILFGEKNKKAKAIKIRYHFKSGSGYINVNWRGVVPFLEARYRKTESDVVRKDIEQYMLPNVCPDCGGSRLRDEVNHIFVHGKNIASVGRLDVEEAISFFEGLKLSQRETFIAKRILKEIVDRLHFLKNVGLGYLSLNRKASTLSGGESQRIRLASQVGSQLVGVLYVLDEPSIGLHARDNEKLLKTLTRLRDIGNTLIVIEHDEETIRRSDYLVDIGPGAGKYGGKIMAHGTPEEVAENETSLTARYLRFEDAIPMPNKPRKIQTKKHLLVKNASEHNLKNIDVTFPLGVLNVVTGVSGSGKSTLVEEILYKGAAGVVSKSPRRPGKHKEIRGLDHLNKVILMDQSPIGRTPRSNPATYIGFFTAIRTLFSLTEESRIRGYQPGRFSFNVDGGRCENCRGEGYLKIEMQFMPDVYLPCDICRGTRYNSETLRIHYKGKTISDVLGMTVSEAKDFFESFPEIHRPLSVLEDVGMGYIELGQSATTFSGGEAQRIKLASELSKRSTGKTLYILDEPTTGLHFEDVKKLLEVLHRLVDQGNTVVVIEHHMDVIKNADWIVDLGPGGGEKGGEILFQGTPQDLVKKGEKSYTALFLKKHLG